MIVDIESLRTIFSRMEANGFNFGRPLKWGFFFIDANEESLRNVQQELSGHDYAVEDLHQSDDGAWVLQLSKTEVLTCEKLHRRNIAFNELAEYCNVSSYDGWDVGRV